MEPKVCNDQEMPIDPQVHRRFLRFLNRARIPEDLMVAPHDRKVVGEDAARLSKFTVFWQKFNTSFWIFN